jgi:5-formyltetrahydrofolate cyclo-ligase
MTDDPKTTLRQQLRARRRAHAEALGAIGCTAMAQDAAQRLRPLWQAGRIVVGYVATNGEISALPCLSAAAAAGCVTGLGWIGDTPDSMVFRQWTPGAALAEGAFGVRQPMADAAVMAPDIILTPLVGFDADRNRLGQGGGFYDRIFLRHPLARRIGLAWAIQQCDSLPLDPWDQPLDVIATEAQLFGELTP